MEIADPKYPEYSSLQSRLDSYAGWPQRVVGVSPASLAASGFFYIGFADRVRCFQCGVTLRDWEPEDDAATEHAKWSPACPIGIAPKPPGRDSKTNFPDVPVLLHPQDGRTNGEPPPPTPCTGVAHRSAAPASRGEEAVSGGEEAVSTAAGLEPPSVLAVLELGCSRDAVDRVRERRRRLQGTDFPDAASLYLAVMEEESETQVSQPPGVESVFPPGDTGHSSEASAPVTSTVHQEEAAAMVVTEDLSHSLLRMETDLEVGSWGRTHYTDLTSFTSAVMEEAERRAAAMERINELAALVADLGVEWSDLPYLTAALEDLEVPPSRAVLGTCWYQGCHQRAVILVLPCGHVPFCPPCSTWPRTCPICRRKIRATTGFY